MAHWNEGMCDGDEMEVRLCTLDMSSAASYLEFEIDEHYQEFRIALGHIS